MLLFLEIMFAAMTREIMASTKEHRALAHTAPSTVTTEQLSSARMIIMANVQMEPQLLGMLFMIAHQ